MSVPTCTSIFGHRFEQRYDYGAPDFSRFKGNFEASPFALSALKPRTYVHDICVRCGHVIDRPTPPTNTEGETK